jgi:penicillin-binding protein 1A
MPRKDKRDRRATVLRVLRIAAVACLSSALALFIAAGTLLAAYSHGLPSTEELRENYNPPQTNRFFAADGTIIGETFTERRKIVQMAQVPRFVVNAVLSAEDADFLKHEGLDYPGILRALVKNLVRGEASQGASTITQQVARTFYLGREKTFKRKIKELLLARRIEQNMSKEEILFLYLNQICWGHGRYGIQEASLYYTGKEVSDISLAEAALLAGLPKGPEIYSPFKSADKARERRAWVLEQMLTHGYITKKEADEAAAEPIPAEPFTTAEPALGAEFVDVGLHTLEKLVGKEKAGKGGYKIYTTMNPALQQAAKEAVAAGLGKIDGRRRYLGPVGFKKKKKGKGGGGDEACPWHPSAVVLKPAEKPALGRIYSAVVLAADDGEGKILLELGAARGAVKVAGDIRYNPDDLPASLFARKGCSVRVSLVSGTQTFKGETVARLRLEMGPEAALVALDVESAGVVALVGGAGYRRGDFNRALLAVRQPGSAFKTFVYLTALKERKITPATMIEDTPLAYEDFQPRNYETWHFEGSVRLRRALAESINLVAVRVAELTGVGAIVELAGKLGITSKLEPNLALALGASGVTPLDMANAYGTIARGGIRWDPVIVTKIVGPDGKEVKLPERPPPARVIGQAEAFLISNMLESVVKEGTGKEALALKRPCAGKTGTSNAAKDAWFVGFVPSLVTAVWVGFDDYKPLGKNETGSSAALPVWLRFMKKATRDMTVQRFGLPPDGIVTSAVDPLTGLLPYPGEQETITEVFLKGTEPVQQAEIVVEELPDAAVEASPPPVPDATADM